MALQWFHFLIVCPLVGLAGFVDAVAGGGGLISLPAYLIVGLPTHFAIGTNKISSGMGTTVATIKYARSGFIPWKIAFPGIFGALAGSALGAQLALLVSDRYFKLLLLVILPATALYVLRGRTLEEKPAIRSGKSIALALILAFLLGIYDGFYGPGTGTFLILLLTSLAHLSLTDANGTSKVINLSTNIAAIVTYLLNGKVLLPLGLAAGCFNMLGNWLGAQLFRRVNAKAVRPVMLLVLGIFFIKVLTELFGG